MSASSPRIGLIGAGYIGGVHSAGYRAAVGSYADAALERLEMAVVADPDATRSERLRRSWGWVSTSTDWRTVTRSPNIDIVDICAPNAAHRDIALDAIEHGKHVICEKPLALDVDGARRMWAAASRAQILTQVCFYYRLWPTLSTIKDVVDAGAIGTLQHFKGHMLQDYAASPRTDLGWRAQSSQAGAGAITDLGSHIIDVARYLCGDISHVTALTRGLVERPHASTDVDDLAALLVRFANGATGTIEASWALRGHRCDLAFDLVGDRGAVRFAWERANEFELLTGDMGDPNNGFRRVLLGAEHGDAGRFIGVPAQGMGYRDAFTIGVGTFVSAFARGEKQVEPTFDAGVAVASVVDAALRSAAVGEWVEVRRVT